MFVLIGQVDASHIMDDTGVVDKELVEEGQERIKPKDKLEVLALEVERALGVYGCDLLCTLVPLHYSGLCVRPTYDFLFDDG